MPGTKPTTIYDQMGYEVNIPSNPRIISLVPSQTELLFDLGAEAHIFGLTKFCVHPADKVKEKSIIGGTKKFKFDTIDALNPNLIIGNKEENYQAGIDKLKEKYPVWMSDISTRAEALDMIQKIGALCGQPKKAKRLADQIQSKFQQLQKQQQMRVLYFIWQKPYMIAGTGTFIDDMLQAIGLNNVAPQPRYPEVSLQDINALQPDVILLASEPYPFKEKHKLLFEEAFPKVRVKLVDGEMFSWYGSRLLKAIDYFNQLKL